MDEITQTHLDNLHAKNREVQSEAYSYLIAATDKPVDWAYEIWDEMVKGLTDKDNLVRAVAAQVLCNLAKSDPEKRMLRDLPALVAVTKDERFVTARHCMQNLWKVGAAGKGQQQLLVDGLAGRFQECISEKNCNLIRYDIIVSLKNLYDQVQDESIKEKALELIATEEDLKYRKKYATVWKSRSAKG